MSSTQPQLKSWRASSKRVMRATATSRAAVVPRDHISSASSRGAPLTRPSVLAGPSEETGVRLDAEPTFLGTHEHLDGLGQPALSHFFRAVAPEGLPRVWQHIVSGDDGDAALVFDCRFDPVPELWPVQSVFRSGE